MSNLYPLLLSTLYVTQYSIIGKQAKQMMHFWGVQLWAVVALPVWHINNTYM